MEERRSRSEAPVVKPERLRAAVSSGRVLERPARRDELPASRVAIQRRRRGARGFSRERSKSASGRVMGEGWAFRRW